MAEEGQVQPEKKTSVELEDTGAASDARIELLQRHLPFSMPVLRRLQFTKHEGGTTAHGHVLIATSGGDDKRHFAAAYADFTKAPETQLWLYSTLEDSLGAYSPSSFASSAEIPLPEAEVELCVEQVLSLLRRCKELSREAVNVTGEQSKYGDGFMIGSIRETLRELLLARGVTTSYWNLHDKWLFRVEDLPPAGKTPPLAKNMVWDRIKREDVPLIVSRTHLPKAEATLMSLPNLGVRLRDGTLIAWAFLGPEGTLSTLHNEEPYRGRGIAKALATKLIREHNHEYGDDGWCAADVHIDNAQSQGVCTSIGGKKAWRDSW